MKPLSRQRTTETITKNILFFIITKTKQAPIFHTMVKIHQSSIPSPPWVGTLKTQQISKIGVLDHGQTKEQQLFFYQLELLAPTKGISSYKEAE
jgi:hypothetical protein